MYQLVNAGAAEKTRFLAIFVKEAGFSSEPWSYRKLQ
jgi:hypothetical protein